MRVHLIGGCGSSGTTLLARVLDGVHDLRSGPELGVFHHRHLYRPGDFRTTLYGLLTGRGDNRSVRIERLSMPLVPPVFFQDRAFYGVDSLQAELSLLDRTRSLEDLGTALRHGMARRLRVRDDFLLVDQTPKNCLAAREFLERVPEGRFLHLVRDGRDVVRSLARRYASEAKGHSVATYVQAGMARWTYDVTQAHRAAHLPGYLEVRYEELVTAPLATLNRILAHLDRPPVGPEALEPGNAPSFAAARERFHGGPKPTWTRGIDQPIDSSGVGKWRESFDDALIAQMYDWRLDVRDDGLDYRMGPLLERYAWEG